MKLHSRITGLCLSKPLILRVAQSADRSEAIRKNEVLLLNDSALKHDGFGLNVLAPGVENQTRLPQLPNDFNYVSAGDIIRFQPSGNVSVLYRKNSPHNSMLITEQCNSKCIMCSQPPRDIDDTYLIEDWLQAVPLMAQETPALGITGGEPTLRFDRLLNVIQATKENLPNTSLHMLSNGRLFNYLKYAERIAAIQHHDLMIGIPLYADVDEIHDFVVQAKGAFSQTLLGILNLGRVKQKIEVRFVMHRFTFERMPQFAKFMVRNLPFVNHVTFMGLEIMGYAKSNLEALWIDPTEYSNQLEKAVFELAAARMNVSIYNSPLCLLPKTLWPFARKSISDWKNIFFSECASCAVQDFCSGFFASAEIKHSDRIRALDVADKEYIESLM